jgi:hypothetical protein
MSPHTHRWRTRTESDWLNAWEKSDRDHHDTFIERARCEPTRRTAQPPACAPGVAGAVGLFSQGGLRLSTDDEIAGKGMMFLVVDDVAAERLSLRGLSIVLGADMEGDYPTLAKVRDPDGNLLTPAMPPSRPYLPAMTAPEERINGLERPLSAGRRPASEYRQLIFEGPLVGGPRFAASDIGREVRIFLQYSGPIQSAQHRHHQ